jgi:coatomer subunit gamma
MLYLHTLNYMLNSQFTVIFSILQQILHFLGNEGPKTSDPSKYIRYIYNRVILENATVRASAVSTLAKLGALVDSLKVFQHYFCMLIHPFYIMFANKFSLSL